MPAPASPPTKTTAPARAASHRVEGVGQGRQLIGPLEQHLCVDYRSAGGTSLSRAESAAMSSRE